MLTSFHVEFIGTTDDPIDNLSEHKKYGSISVTPTFRPDKLFSFDESYIEKLGEVAGVNIDTLDDLLLALSLRLDFFISKGCRMADHGMDRFPEAYATYHEACALFGKRNYLHVKTEGELSGLKAP